MVDAHRSIRERLANLDPGQRSRLIAELRAARASRPTEDTLLLPLNSGGSWVPLFFLHTSGGSAVPYMRLASHLDPRQTCYGIQAAELSGAGDRGIAEMTERYRAMLTEVYPGGPYRLAGWSAGGVLAFALASRLRADGAQVDLLVLLDSEPPPLLDEPPDLPTTLCMFAADYAMSLGHPTVPLDAAAVAAAPPAAQLDLVVAELVTRGLVPAGMGGEVAARARAFTTVVRDGATWRPGRYDGRLDLLVSEETPDVAAAAAAWQPLTSGPVVAHPVAGDHYSMMRPPHVGAVAAIVTKLVAEVTGG